LQEHVIHLADPFSAVQPLPVLNIEPNYFYKVGLGLLITDMFDIGMFYEGMGEQNQKYEGPFKSTYPLAWKYTEKSLGFDYGGNDSKRFQDGMGSATGKYSFEVIDLETGITFRLNPGVYYRITIGGRYAKYNQSMSVNRWNEYCEPSSPNNDGSRPCNQDYEPFGSDRQLSQKIDGFGPRFGLSVIAPIKNSNINLIGSLSYSIVYAKKEIYDIFSYIVTAGDSKEILTEMRNSIGYYRQNILMGEIEESIVRHFNIECGVQYEFKLSETIMILMTGGYKYSAHYGALNSYGKSLKYVNPKSNLVGISYGNKQDDLILQGPFLKVGIKF